MPCEKEMAILSSILAGKIPRIEERGGLSMVQGVAKSWTQLNGEAAADGGNDSVIVRLITRCQKRKCPVHARHRPRSWGHNSGGDHRSVPLWTVQPRGEVSIKQVFSESQCGDSREQGNGLLCGSQGGQKLQAGSALFFDEKVRKMCWLFVRNNF